jgi:hypothetical protein
LETRIELVVAVKIQRLLPSELMPFTVAHAAAALPLRRLNLVWSAFLVGSMAPDFPYVVGSITYRSLGHNFPGVLLFTLPASFYVLWFFHFAIKRPVAGLLPIAIQQRLTGQIGEFKFGVNRILAITFSIILGIATHLVWDSLTHPYTWPGRHWAWLRFWIELPVAGWTPLFMILQYASTFIGLFALGVWTLLWYQNTAPVKNIASQPQLRSRVWLAIIMFAIAFAAGLLRAWLLIGMVPRNIHHWDWFMLQFGVTAIAVAFWELLFYCLIMTMFRRNSGNRQLCVM